MSDVFDYIEWRGDLSMESEKVNDVDILILCKLSYIPFDNIVKEDPVLLKNAAAEVLSLVKCGERKLKRKEDEKLLDVLSNSPRFSDISLRHFVDIYSEEIGEQFSALTVALGDGTLAVVYRGTDNTLVGWKEDFELTFTSEIPAQSEAVKYLEYVAKEIPDKKLRLCGHSKGGNLSVYAATNCTGDIQSRIISVRNFDGPGFNEFQTSEEKFKRISDITLTYLPETSVIGMLLGHMEKCTVVGSKSSGISSHNMYLWEIFRNGFIVKDDVSNGSLMLDRTIKCWLASLTKEQRENIVEGFFCIIQASDGKTMRDLLNVKNALAILSAVKKTDSETKRNIAICIKLLSKAIRSSLKAKQNTESPEPARAKPGRKAKKAEALS